MCSNEKRMKNVKKYNANIKEKNVQAVKDAINKLKKDGKFTLADLCREAGVSRTYFSKHPEMRKLADKYITPTGYNKNRNKDSQDTYIHLLQTENKKLKKELEKIEKQIMEENKYKEKYEVALNEIEKLKEQLDAVYSSNLPDFL